MSSVQVLLIESDPLRQDRMRICCEVDSAYQLHFASELDRAMSRLQDQQFQLIIAPMPADQSKVRDEFERLKNLQPDAEIVVSSADLSINLVRSTMQLGATDVVDRDDEDQLLNCIRERTEALSKDPQAPKATEKGLAHIIGLSSGMRSVFQSIEQLAGTNVDVLIHGETGTGKELVARAIHELSPRHDKRFVPVDCGAIPENLLESEFFGYEQGAFTGADRSRPGLMEFSDRGTFFLDEIGELPLLLQAKLLRTLQERQLRRVGGREQIPIDLRIVAATARSLPDMVRQKTFREDLFYRINVVTIDLPPLRDRGDDLGLLAEQFAARFSREMGKPVVGISAEAYEILSQYDWPGNVRELQNVIRRGIALTQQNLIVADDLPLSLTSSTGKSNQAEGFFAARDQHVREFEARYLSRLLETHQGNVKAAAEQAQLPRGTLYRLMKNHNIDGADYR